MFYPEGLLSAKQGSPYFDRLYFNIAIKAKRLFIRIKPESAVVIKYFNAKFSESGVPNIYDTTFNNQEISSLLKPKFLQNIAINPKHNRA
ncbi:MAG: hypothetical protein FWG35_00900 [Spirochaetaceae bacterium]|nr:hypothetical protein [Spirochaetaceae bacterium]